MSIMLDDLAPLDNKSLKTILRQDDGFPGKQLLHYFKSYK